MEMDNQIEITCTAKERNTILTLIEDANDVCIFENDRPSCWGDCVKCARDHIRWTIKDERRKEG